jgi:hypothetical protein
VASSLWDSIVGVGTPVPSRIVPVLRGSQLLFQVHFLIITPFSFRRKFPPPRAAILIMAGNRLKGNHLSVISSREACEKSLEPGLNLDGGWKNGDFR